MSLAHYPLCSDTCSPWIVGDMYAQVCPRRMCGLRTSRPIRWSLCGYQRSSPWPHMVLALYTPPSRGLPSWRSDPASASLPALRRFQFRRPLTSHAELRFSINVSPQDASAEHGSDPYAAAIPGKDESFCIWICAFWYLCMVFDTYPPFSKCTYYFFYLDGVWRNILIYCGPLRNLPLWAIGALSKDLGHIESPWMGSLVYAYYIS